MRTQLNMSTPDLIKRIKDQIMGKSRYMVDPDDVEELIKRYEILIEKHNYDDKE